MMDMLQGLGVITFISIFAIALLLTIAGLSKSSPYLGSIGSILILGCMMFLSKHEERYYEDQLADSYTRQQLVDRGLAQWVLNATNNQSHFEWKPLVTRTNTPAK